MTTTDVDPNAGNAREERFTNHVFELSLEGSVGGHSGQAIRVPSNDTEKSEWPPTSLFEAIYASTVMYHFGVTPGDLLNKWDAVFYEPGGASNPEQADNQRRHDQDNAEKENRERHREARKRRYNERQQGYRGHRGRRAGGLDGLDMLTILPFTAMPAEKVRQYLEGCQQVAAAKEQNELEEKVNSWREGL